MRREPHSHLDGASHRVRMSKHSLVEIAIVLWDGRIVHDGSEVENSSDYCALDFEHLSPKSIIFRESTTWHVCGFAAPGGVELKGSTLHCIGEGVSNISKTRIGLDVKSFNTS